MPDKWRTIKSWVYTKFDFTVDEGKIRLNPSRDENQGKHRRRKVDKSCVTFLLCDPGWSTSLTSGINGMTIHTHTHTGPKVWTCSSPLNSPALDLRQISACSDASASATVDGAHKSLAGALGRSM